jgi:uncharacterized LabA/DUF88 family protein
MVSTPDTLSMALFCDFENVALGVREANHEKFDIRLVLERLLLKGSITVKKAYCDWERYKGFKAIMHEANFELIEIPHVRQSGKNSADIRLVVDALDLCYTKAHVNTFVIISGDSDFSPLVSKLRENAKQVIGVGVKRSTSDLLVANCDEFIFYDDLVKSRNTPRNRQSGKDQPSPGAVQPVDTHRSGDRLQSLKDAAIAMTVETFDALLSERGDSGKIWASTLKQAIKRRKPDFTESYYGFRAFGNLLDEAQARGLLAIGKDEKSGTFVYRPDTEAQPAAGDKTQVSTTKPREPAPADVPDNDASGSPDGTAAAPARKKTRSASRKPRKAAPASLDAAGEDQTAARAGSGADETPALPVDTAPKTAAKTARKSTRRTSSRKKTPDDAA